MNHDADASDLKYGALFYIAPGQHGKITGLYALGFHYHTIDDEGNCIEGQQYMLRAEFKSNQQ